MILDASHRLLRHLAVLLIVGLAIMNSPAGGAADEYGEIDVVTEDSTDRESHLDLSGGADAYLEFKRRLQESTGLAYTVEYSPILQWGGDEFHSNHELNLIGFWNARRNESSSGTLLAWFQQSQTLGDLSTSEFMSELGVLSPVNGGDTGSEKSAHRWQLLAWEQYLGGDLWRLMAGKITTRVTFNLNRFAVSDREDFFSPMIVNNPVSQYTARVGLGLYTRLQQSAGSIAVMIRDADATDDFIDFESLDSGRWEYLAELELTPEFSGLGDGNYRFTYYYSDPVELGALEQPATWSLALSADQELGEVAGTFLRFAYAEPPLRDFRRRLAAGAQLLNPLGYEDDRIGLAAWWGDPTDNQLSSEWGVEAFWRFQVLELIDIAPDVQAIFSPAGDPDSGVRMVYGIRVHILL